MYPLTCYAGYALPVRVGKFEVCQIIAALEDIDVDAKLTLIDDQALTETSVHGRILPDSEDYKTPIIELKSNASTVGELIESFHEPIKLRKGISIVACDNLKPGKIFVYVR